MVDVKLLAILPRAIIPLAIWDEVDEEFDKETKIVLKMFGKIVRTWNRKPDFIVQNITQRRLGGDIDLIIGPDISNEAGKKFVYLDKGTSTRHAVMSNPFVPKSRARKIGSWRGRGKAVFVSRQVSQPGIKPREWCDEIRKRRESPFQTKIKWAVARGARGIFIP